MITAARDRPRRNPPPPPPPPPHQCQLLPSLVLCSLSIAELYLTALADLSSAPVSRYLILVTKAGHCTKRCCLLLLRDLRSIAATTLSLACEAA
jgi:hypothetical protein